MPLDWDDLRYFLAVIDHGSTKRAATALKVDQTTCARRIASLEASLGLELFTRDEGRYRPTQDALELVQSAKAMSAAAANLHEQVEGRKRTRSSKLKITGEEAMAAAFIFPAVARFTRLRPDVEVEVDVSSDKRDLLAGEADLAVRGGFPPDEPNLVRRKLGDDPFGFYSSWSYPTPPATYDDLRENPIACFDVVRERLGTYGLGARVRHVTNSATALRRIIEEGSVVGLLPRSVAEATPALRLCIQVPAESSIWLVYPDRLRGQPHVRELGRLLLEEFRKARKEGRVG